MDDFQPTAFERYLAGEATLSERERFEAWLAEDASRQHLLHAFEDMRALPADITRIVAAVDRYMALGDVQNDAEAKTVRSPSYTAGTRTVPHVGHGIVSRWRKPLFWGIGFAAVLMIGMSLPRVWPAFVGGTASRISAESQRYSTQPGERTQVALAGGSRMTLAPATTVEVTPESVTVQGEAYFEIVPSQNQPFVVTTANAEVRVLGTRFTVRHYAGDNASRIVVEDGKVSLHASQQRHADAGHAILAARMLGTVVDSNVTVTSGVAVSNFIGWVRGRLVFEEARLDQVVVELARAYGTEIRIADTILARQPLTMQASVDTQSITQLLDFIGHVTNARYTRVGNAFVLVPGRAAARVPAAKTYPSPEKVYGK